MVKRMKKLASPILLLGLMAVLSSCVIVTSSPGASNFQFASSWQRTSDNAYVGCTNRSTQFQYSFQYNDLANIVSWTETYIGYASGRTYGPFTRTTSNVTQIDTANKRIIMVVDIVYGNNAVPQSLVGKQSITPVPIPVPTSNVGTTTLRVTVNLANGNTVTQSYPYDAYSNCP